MLGLSCPVTPSSLVTMSIVGSAESRAIQEALALFVKGPGKTSVGKVTSALLEKAAAHQTGKIMKTSNILPQQDLKLLLEVEMTCMSDGMMVVVGGLRG